MAVVLAPPNATLSPTITSFRIVRYDKARNPITAEAKDSEAKDFEAKDVEAKDFEDGQTDRVCTFCKLQTLLQVVVLG